MNLTSEVIGFVSESLTAVGARDVLHVLGLAEVNAISTSVLPRWYCFFAGWACNIIDFACAWLNDNAPLHNRPGCRCRSGFL